MWCDMVQWMTKELICRHCADKHPLFVYVAATECQQLPKITDKITRDAVPARARSLAVCGYHCVALVQRAAHGLACSFTADQCLPHMHPHSSHGVLEECQHIQAQFACIPCRYGLAPKAEVLQLMQRRMACQHIWRGLQGKHCEGFLRTWCS